MSDSVRYLALLLLPMLAMTPRAEACGQQTHTWIAMEAQRSLPDGPLKQLLASEEGSRFMVNGAMFPDGGYAINHPYGEAAHWAPFQVGFQRWIARNFDDPLNDPEAVPYVAFAMGMAAHGLADELYDATFFAASRVHDAVDGVPDHHDNFDTATDILFAAHSGQRISPDAELPMDAILEVYGELELEISAEDIDRAQNLLRTAAWFVATAADSGADVAHAAEQYPWASEHIGSRAISGAPPVIAEAVASYWQLLVRRLVGQEQALQFVHQWPRPGEALTARTAGAPEARVAWMLSRPVGESEQLQELGSSVDHDGAAIAHRAQFFYGDHSHVVIVDPEQDWPEAEALNFRVNAGLELYDGSSSDDALEGEFRTKPVAVEPPPESGWSCSSAPVGLWWLLPPMLLRRRR